MPIQAIGLVTVRPRPEDTGLDPDRLKRVVTVWIDAIERLSGSASKGTIIFLNAVGALLAIMAFVLKTVGGKLQLVELQPIEFIALLTLGLGLFVVAALLRFMEYRTAVEWMRYQIRERERIAYKIYDNSGPPVIP